MSEKTLEIYILPELKMIIAIDMIFDYGNDAYKYNTSDANEIFGDVDV